MNGSWVAPDLRDEVVDFVAHWSARTELPVRTLVDWLKTARDARAASQSPEAIPIEHNRFVQIRLPLQ